MAEYRFNIGEPQERIVETNERFRGTDEEWRIIWEKLIPPGNMSARHDLLDAGCGEHIWKCNDWEVIRCDNWQKYLTRNDSPREDVRILDLGAKWPYYDKLFNGVIATDVIEHMENTWHFMREAFRVSRDFVVIATPNVESAFSRYCLIESGWLLA